MNTMATQCAIKKTGTLLLFHGASPKLLLINEGTQSLRDERLNTKQHLNLRVKVLKTSRRNQSARAKCKSQNFTSLDIIPRRRDPETSVNL
jgi:hypothetical protein